MDIKYVKINDGSPHEMVALGSTPRLEDDDFFDFAVTDSSGNAVFGLKDRRIYGADSKMDVSELAKIQCGKKKVWATDSSTFFAPTGGKTTVCASFTAPAAGGTLKVYVNSVSNVYDTQTPIAAGANKIYVDFAHLAVYESAARIAIAFPEGSTGAEAYTVDNDLVEESDGLTFKETLESLSGLSSGSSLTSGVAALKGPDGSEWHPLAGSDGVLRLSPQHPRVVGYTGNSITRGNVDYGMDATDADHYWMAYVEKRLKESVPDCSVYHFKPADFESCVTEERADAAIKAMTATVRSDSDMLLVQLLDNVNTDAKWKCFSTYSCAKLTEALREKAPGARVYWLAAWYASNEKMSKLKEIAASRGAGVVDFLSIKRSSSQNSHLGHAHKVQSGSRTYKCSEVDADEDAKTIRVKVACDDGSEVWSDRFPYSSYSRDASAGTATIVSEWALTTSGGVASHPGDAGMKDIADKIINDLNL